MGDSTCFMQQPFCYASGISNESNENNPIHALGNSISFGRFMSESLAWEKWSSFSHNRYVEEAERFSRPGSVAQKKAFFEAHYKKLAAQKAAAAALLEQQNNNASQNNATHDDSETSLTSDIVVKDEQDEKVLILTSSEVDSNVEEMEGAQPEMEDVAIVGNSMEVELQNQIEEVVDNQKEQSEKISESPTIMTPIVKLEEVVETQKEQSEKISESPSIMKIASNNDQQVLASMSKKKPPVSSMKWNSKFISTTTTPVKSTAPSSSKKDNIANLTTPISSNNKPCASDKKRYTPKSLQMSVNFTPIRELNRLTASVMRKFENTRNGAGSSKASKDNLTPLRTPIVASKEMMQKHSSLTPLTEKKRNKTPIDLSSSNNHTAGPKWRFLPAENKMRSPVISSPFSLRTEERAARRKKKLEEKFNANEAQKVQLHTKLKEKAGTEIRKLRQSFCFTARPLPDFYKERKASKNDTKKDPVTHSELLKEGRKATPSMVVSKTPFPSSRPSLKNSSSKKFLGKSGHSSTHPITANYATMITTPENTSPNIQHGYHNDRSYKQ